MQNSGIDGPNGWVLKNKVFDNGYYAELIGGQDPNTDTTDTMVNNAPPWVRLFQSSAGNGFPDERYWRGTPSHVNIVMVRVKSTVRQYNLTDCRKLLTFAISYVGAA